MANDKIARYTTPSEGAFLGALIRAGANFIRGRHKDSIRSGLERSARMGMWGRRKVKGKHKAKPKPMVYAPNITQGWTGGYKKAWWRK